MTCHGYRERITVHLAEGSEAPGDHGASCPDCARYAELARGAWEAAGRDPDDAVPPALAETILNFCRRPRRADLTLLRPGSLAAAAVLAVGLLVLLWPAKALKEERLMFEADGMSVERYDLPAGVEAARVAEEIRRDLSPEAWGEGASGLEAGKGFLRVRAPAELQRAVREYLRRHP
jgi:hypothetical protein